MHLGHEKYYSWVHCETEIIGGVGGGRNGHHLIGGNVRLSSAVGISSSDCEHPGLFFLLLPCSPSLAFGLALWLLEVCASRGRHIPRFGV